MIKSWMAFLIWLAALVAAFIWTTHKPTAPFSTFAEWGTIGFIAYATKRIVQKAKAFTENGNGDK